jgi:hypothetical protein
MVVRSRHPDNSSVTSAPGPLASFEAILVAGNIEHGSAVFEDAGGPKIAFNIRRRGAVQSALNMKMITKSYAMAGKK